jgi:hypothetical protein
MTYLDFADRYRGHRHRLNMDAFHRMNCPPDAMRSDSTTISEFGPIPLEHRNLLGSLRSGT